MILNCIWWWDSISGALEKYGVTSSLLLLPGSLWPGVVVPVRVPSMSQVKCLEND